MEHQTFCQWIKRLRAEQDLTQEKLAEIIGCAVPTLRAFETGKRRPSRAMAEHVAEVMHVPADQRAHFLALARLPVESQAEKNPGSEAPDSGGGLGGLSATLPHPANVLIGRESERQALLHLLGPAGQRLVTLVGTGGMGKTRLALEVAASLAPAFPDGAAFVSLAPVDSAYGVPGAISEALGLSQHGSRDPRLVLNETLRPRRLLLVLDNFEHLLAAGPGAAEPDATQIIRDLLQQAPHIQLLVTSRERLRLSSERIFELGGLPVPDAATAPEQTDAGLLFLERARQVQSSFTLTPHNRAAVTRICQLVDGMPLAIELAASWVRALSCEDIAAELGRGIDFLALADRDAPARHRSLRAVFDHSWRLLSEQEQAVLARLSVFQRGCTRQAAQAVAGASLPILVGLIDKSLLRAMPNQNETRYDLHELVRQYAAERLQEARAQDETEARHSQYYADLLQAGQIIEASEQVEWLERLTAEADNVRAAWQWAIRQPRLDLIRQMGRTLVGVYELNGWLHEAATLFEAAYAALAAAPGPSGGTEERQLALGYIQSLCGFFLTRSGQYALARRRLLESYRLLQAHPAALAETPALFVLGYLSLMHGEYAEGRQWFGLSQSVYTANGQIFWRELGNDYYARLLWAEGAREEARQVFAETLAQWRQIGNPSGLSSLLSPYGGFVLEDGDLAQAEALIREGVQHAFSGGHRSAMVMGQHFLGRWALAAGDPGEARRLQQESLDLAREIGDLWAQCLALNELGKIELYENCPQAAWEAFAETLRIAEPVNLKINALTARLGQAEVLLCQGKTGQAVPLLHEVAAAPQSQASDRLRAGQLLENG